MKKIVLFNMCAIYNDNNEFLLQNRVSKYWPGYAFAGGKIEEGESIVESTKREIKEETGLTVYDLKYCGIVNWETLAERYLVFIYKTNNYSGELLDRTSEGDNQWFSKDQIYSLNLANGFEKHLEIVFADEILESFNNEFVEN